MAKSRGTKANQAKNSSSKGGKARARKNPPVRDRIRGFGSRVVSTVHFRSGRLYWRLELINFDHCQDYRLETQKELLEKFKKVCICRGVTAGTIMKAIKNGALSFEALRRTIGIGTGNCKAKRCRHKIIERIHDHKQAMKAEAEETNDHETKVPALKS